jgi:hypothetical protein
LLDSALACAVGFLGLGLKLLNLGTAEPLLFAMGEIWSSFSRVPTLLMSGRPSLCYKKERRPNEVFYFCLLTREDATDAVM